MRRDILIDGGLVETRVAVLDDGRLSALAVEEHASPDVSGTIWLGRVLRVVPGINGAFVALGIPMAGFLGARDAKALGEKAAGPAAIVRQVREGDAVIVQGRKAPQGEKGVKLTTDVALPGRLLVHMPRSAGIKISGRIADAAERARLAATLGDLGAGGFIARTQAAGAPSDDIKAEAEVLMRQWQAILHDAKARTAPAELWRDAPLIVRSLRDYLTADTAAVWFSTRAALGQARGFMEAAGLGGLDRLALHEASTALFEHHGVEAEIERALASEVVLPSGGRIIIETTRALTAIDVDSAGHTGGDLEATALRVNLEAGAEIARQIRLRNLGGIVAIDFIPLKEAVHRERLFAALRTAFAADSAAIRFFGYSALGLVEFTRRRQGPPLAEILTEVCNACSGVGVLPKAATIAAALLRRAEAEARANPGRPLALSAPPEVMTVIEAAGGAAALIRHFGVQVVLKVDPAAPRSHFDVSSG
jgi:ribonuclease G